MDQERAVNLYLRAYSARDALGGPTRVARFDTTLREAAAHPLAAQFEHTAHQHLHDLANFTNEFVYNHRKLQGWEAVLSELEREEKLAALVEFVNPLIYFCISAPAALKGRLHHSIAMVSHLANEYVVDGWTYQSDLGKSCAATASQHAKAWPGWRDLSHRVGALDNREFKAAVEGFRTEFHHGAPRLVELGNRSVVHRDGNGAQIYGIQDALGVTEIVGALAAQRDAAVDAHESFTRFAEGQWAAIGG